MTSTRPPSVCGTTRAAAAIHRRSVSSATRRSGRASKAHPSSSSAAPYAARGSAPGVATTISARAATVLSTGAPPPEMRTGTPGNARPSSSAVRREPTTPARSLREPQAPHR